jgi:death-on-curing protein
VTRYLTTEQTLRIARHAVGGPDHALVDGNKRLVWLATYVFLAKNAVELDPGDDEAYALVVGVGAGESSDLAEIAAALGEWTA